MRTIAAFILGALACFIVMRFIAHDRPKPTAGEITADSDAARPSIANRPVAASAIERSLTRAASHDELSRSKPAPARGIASTLHDRSPDQQSSPHQRPASELIDEMIHSAGDAVMGNPLLAPHQQLQEEAKDDPWSTLATGSIRDNLQSNLGSNFEFPAVECGTDICEIQAATINPVSGFSSGEFQDTLRTMGQEPWWSTMQLGHPSCTYSGSKNGRALIVCFVAREG